MAKIGLIRFGGDKSPSSSSERELRDLIDQCDDLYPGIDRWFKRKVLPDLHDKARLAYLVKLGSEPVGATIIKRGPDAKICSLRIVQDQQGQNLGELLFTMAALELRGLAEQVHFTAPSQLWTEKSEFFQKLGFRCEGPASIQYRLFDQEVACRATFQSFWSSVMNLLPELGESLQAPSSSTRCDLVMSMKPANANRVMSGQKRIEVRRRFSNKWQGSRAIVYSSESTRAFVGEMRIGKVERNSPREIWRQYKGEIGCDEASFYEYCQGADTVFAIQIKDVEPFRDPILGTQLEHLIGQDIRPPQSYCEIQVNSVWPAAVTLGHLLRSGVST